MKAKSFIVGLTSLLLSTLLLDLSATITTSEAEIYLPRYIENSNWVSTFPQAINNAGQVAGFGLTVGGEWHAFYWEDGLGMIDFGTLGGTESRATSINEEGQVVGWSRTHSGRKSAFLWEKSLSGMIRLGSLGYESEAVAVNDGGILTGSSSMSSSPHSIVLNVHSNPSVIEEANSIVTFSFTVSNELMDKNVMITSIVDSVYGDLNGKGTCSLPQTIEPLGYYQCSFPGLVSGQAGETQTNKVTVSGIDELNNEVSDSDDALVYIKTSAKLSVSIAVGGIFPIMEPGGERTFSVTISNLAQENPEDPDEGKITIASIVDSVYGDLNRGGTEIEAGKTYNFGFSGFVAGVAGDTPKNTITVRCTDETGADIRNSASWSTTIAALRTHAVIWENLSDSYEIKDLGTLSDPTFGSASVAISNGGHVVGNSRLADGANHAFLWEEELGMQEIVPSYRSEAVAVNDLGQAIGNLFVTGGREPFFWDGSSVHFLGTLGGNYANALALNNDGCVVGTSQAPEGPYIRYHAFVWQDGIMKDLWTFCPEGMYCQYARDVNDNGMVVGAGDFLCAFVWTEDTGILPLQTLGGAHSSAVGVNEDGLIIGTSSLADDYWAAPHHATLWKSVERFTTEELFEYLFERLHDYENEGFVRANPLFAKLVDAKKLFEEGNYKGAIQKLNAFINQTNLFLNKGHLRDDQAQWLSIAANAIIDDLNGG